MNGVNNAFARTLQEVRSGHCLQEASEKLQELVSQVRLTGRSGELVVRLKVKPASRGEAVTLMVEDDVSVKLPRLERGTTVFYASEENVLQRNDPRQGELELRTVPALAATAELKAVNQ